MNGPSDVNGTKAKSIILFDTKPSGTFKSFSSDFRGCCIPPRLRSAILAVDNESGSFSSLLTLAELQPVAEPVGAGVASVIIQSGWWEVSPKSHLVQTWRNEWRSQAGRGPGDGRCVCLCVFAFLIHLPLNQARQNDRLYVTDRFWKRPADACLLSVHNSNKRHSLPPELLPRQHQPARNTTAWQQLKSDALGQVLHFKIVSCESH